MSDLDFLAKTAGLPLDVFNECRSIMGTENYGQDSALANAIARACKDLRRQVEHADHAAFVMAAGQCIHPGMDAGGLGSDDRGNQFCGLHSKVAAVKARVQSMIIGATQMVAKQGDEDVVVGYRIKTGALHAIAGDLGVWFPSNMPTERA